MSKLLDDASAPLKSRESLEWPLDSGLKSDVFKPPTNPLWTLDLIVDEASQRFQFSTPVKPFEEAIVNIFNAGIDATAGVLDVEPLLMPHLFWVGVPILIRSRNSSRGSSI
jgi:hypothetical protein